MTTRTLQIEACARAAHEANAAYCQALGDYSQTSWDGAPEWQRSSSRAGVYGVVDKGDGPGDSHRSWLAEKESTGWTYGKIKDPDKREHPCMVPFTELPPEQQQKDHLFVAVVRAMAVALGMSMVAARE